MKPRLHRYNHVGCDLDAELIDINVSTPSARNTSLVQEVLKNRMLKAFTI